MTPTWAEGSKSACAELNRLPRSASARIETARTRPRVHSDAADVSSPRRKERSD